MAANIVEMLDKIMITAANKLPSLILDKIKVIIGNQNNIHKEDVDSDKFTESQFREIEVLIHDTINALNNKMIVEIEKYFKNSMISIPRDEKTKFYNEIKSVTSTFMNFIPVEVRKSVLEAVGNTLDSKKVEEAAKDLSRKINTSIGKSITFINETIVRRVREKNYEVFKKVSNKDTKWKFVHVKDSKNAPFCRDHGNEVKTEAEWLKLKSDIFVEGGHFGCRGVMAVVDDEEE